VGAVYEKRGGSKRYGSGGFHAVTPAEAVAPPKLPVPNGYPIFVMH